MEFVYDFSSLDSSVTLWICFLWMAAIFSALLGPFCFGKIVMCSNNLPVE